MDCVEYLKEYIEIELEKDIVGMKVNLLPNWPKQGHVGFVNFTT